MRVSIKDSLYLKDGALYLCLMLPLPPLTEEPKIITEVISEQGFKAYLVGYDFNKYRWERFIDEVCDVIVEFAFGRHKSTYTENRNVRIKLIDAAKAIYNIPEFSEAANLYLHGKCIKDDDEEKNYLRRGEFGELLLHLLLTDYSNTIPLISKIFFKDTKDETVHGFDAVHIQPDTNTLWLGESKLFFNGKQGVNALIKDLEGHFKENYLNDEFVLIEKKVPEGEAIPNRQHWINLLNQKHKLKQSEIIKYIRIPVLCTYTSPTFSNFSDENSQEFIDAYKKEVDSLRTLFMKSYQKNVTYEWKDSMEITLLLFPVKCKNAFVSRMHQRLYHMQRI
jgi:hypothetical protein